jgi:hypothetical protein
MFWYWAFPVRETTIKELGCRDSNRRRKSSFKQSGFKKFAVLAGKIRIARHRSRSYSTSTQRVGTPLWIQSQTQEPSRADDF